MSVPSTYSVEIEEGGETLGASIKRRHPDTFLGLVSEGGTNLETSLQGFTVEGWLQGRFVDGTVTRVPVQIDPVLTITHDTSSKNVTLAYARSKDSEETAVEALLAGLRGDGSSLNSLSITLGEASPERLRSARVCPAHGGARDCRKCNPIDGIDSGTANIFRGVGEVTAEYYFKTEGTVEIEMPKPSSVIKRFIQHFGSSSPQGPEKEWNDAAFSMRLHMRICKEGGGVDVPGPVPRP